MATVTANVFAQNEEVLSTELIKSNSLVEAQEEFRFDAPSRTVVLSVASIISTEGHRCDGPTMAALADRELSQEMFVQRCGI